MERNCGRAKEKGFTLIELMTVIAIIGILAVVAYPVMNSLKRDILLYSEARKLVADIRYMQQLAVDSDMRCVMTFDNSGSGYQIQAVKDGQSRIFIKGAKLVDIVRYVNTAQNNALSINEKGLPETDIVLALDKKTGNLTSTNSNGSRIYITARKDGKVKMLWKKP